MSTIKQMMKFGLILFLVGGSISAEPGSRFEWVPYALMILGILSTIAYLVIDAHFYVGD